MSTEVTEVFVADSADALADEVVARLLPVLADAQRVHGRAALALTAGSIMERVWSAVAASEVARELDWSRVDVFWGDERFVPAGGSDRNDVPAERLLFGHFPFSSAVRHSMPASDGEFGDDLDAAAAGYAETLGGARRPHEHGPVPSFDVVLLGVGPDGHCCSLFPDHPSSSDLSAPVIPVRESPKPPPLRISFSFDTLTAAREIWAVVSGESKAEATARALGGAERTEVPSAGARGSERTLWLLDREAAAQLPPGVAG